MRMKVAAAGLAAGVVLAGCSSSSSSSTGASFGAPAASASGAGASGAGASGTGASGAGGTAEPEILKAEPAPSGYWTEEKLKAAQEWQAEPIPSESPGSQEGGDTPSATENAKTLRIGALFEHDSSGNHFCTASVVDSPGHNVLETAAHCVNGGRGGSDKQDVAFVPAYSDGQAPFGEWTPERYVMDARWVNDHNEDYDVAFIVLKSYEGKNIQDVLGGNSIAFSTGYRHYVAVTGYPSSASSPVTCQNWTSDEGGFLRFECNHYYGGTSGSPWITDYNTQTRTGTVVGVLGGYYEGGQVHNISYSSYLGDDIKALYDDAAASKG